MTIGIGKKEVEVMKELEIMIRNLNTEKIFRILKRLEIVTRMDNIVEKTDRSISRDTKATDRLGSIAPRSHNRRYGEENRLIGRGVSNLI